MYADFTYVLAGKTITLTDISSGGVIASRLFEIIGLGSVVASSSDEVFVHDIEESGVYTVRLTLTSTDPEEEPSISEILLYVDDSSSNVSISIYETVIELLPVGFTFTYKLFNLYRVKWQSVIGPGILPEIPQEQLTNELVYPYLVNLLIANLITRDIILREANNYLLSSYQSSGGSSSSTTTSGGGIKKIVTGPIETEWFNGSETLKTSFSSGGVYQQVVNTACSLANSLEIYLSFCENSQFANILPKVLKVASQNVLYHARTVVQF